MSISFKTLASAPLVSSRQAVTITDDGKAIQLYPNPSSGQFKLMVRLSERINANAKIEMISASGQAVYTLPGFVSNGILQTTVQVPITVASGMYVVKVTTANEVQHAKLVYSKN